MTAQLIAIYGAYGHMGRLVTAELLARGRQLVLAGRNERALRAFAAELGSPRHVRTHVAPLDDPASLRELAGAAQVLIHCAGPYADTGEPVARAAAEAGCHYLGHAIEPHHVKFMFEEMQGPAQRGGAVMIPQMGFFGAVADLLATVLAEDLAAVDRVTVGYAVTGLRMTPGLKNTIDLLNRQIDQVTFTDGVLRVGLVEIRNAVFPFPLPVGPSATIAPFPSGEVVTIPRHVYTRAVECQLSARTFEERRAFTSEYAAPEDRAGTDFVVAVQAFSTKSGGRIGHVRGRDLWRVSALASVEAALRLIGGDASPGVQSAAEAFPALQFLRTLESLGAFTLYL